MTERDDCEDAKVPYGISQVLLPDSVKLLKKQPRWSVSMMSANVRFLTHRRPAQFNQVRTEAKAVAHAEDSDDDTDLFRNTNRQTPPDMSSSTDSDSEREHT